MDMEYGFVESENKATLIEAVNAQLAAGWQVCGGIAMAFYLTKWGEARRCYAQAMVRPQEQPISFTEVIRSTADSEVTNG